MFQSPHHDALFSGLSPGGVAHQGEPMMLGASSPGSSPSSPPTAGNFLPSFLIGGSSSSSPFVWPGSPGKGQQSFTVSPPSPMQSSLPQATAQTPRSYVGRLGTEKASGPPVQGLLDSLHSPALQSPHRPAVTSQVSTSTPLSGIQGTPMSSLPPGRTLFSQGLVSPAQADPFYTQRENLTLEDQLDETWVTVFGFPPSAASYILQQFSQYGTILEHKLDPKGNWVHLHYQSKLQAKKAISKNGKVFGGSIMVGVKSCIEKSLIDESLKENSVLGSPLRPSLDQSLASSSWRDDSRWGGNSSERSIANMRPLTQAYQVSASERDVKSPQRVPQKNNVFARTMDYMFGW